MAVCGAVAMVTAQSYRYIIAHVVSFVGNDALVIRAMAIIDLHFYKICVNNYFFKLLIYFLSKCMIVYT